ncbi:MAG: alpha/beta fold hydrolase [Pseudomonadota bacterium]
MPTSDPVGTQPPDAESIVPELIDRAHHAAIARATGGVSPAALMEAYFDWLLHLSLAPGKQLQLIQKAVRKSTRLQAYGLRCLATGAAGPPCIQPLQQDKRFNDDEWQALPWSMMSQSFLLTQQWWHNATTGVPGVSKQHERMLDFAARQILDIIAPSNFLATNPVLMKETARQGGANLARGFQNALQDAERRTNKRPPAGADAFQAGRDVALTPGKVVFRNELIELIQYEPQTPEVQKEPILIVPAWIMKYYILDLEPRNSLVRYLVSQGHTVFMISWKNPSSGDRDFRMDDYRKLGIMNALDAVCQVIPDRKIHTAGYCLGGTLLAIAAAAMARDDDHRLASVTFLAAQIDFTEPGELQLFINESQVRFLEDLMWEQGYLDTTQMAGAFRMLRSRDLIWSRMVREYVLGERGSMNALMAWNADGTRMPYAMHSEYLRRLFLNNDLAEGRYPVDGRPIAVTDIRAPIFSVGTTTDHVAPWRSVYKINLLADTEVTFVLTTGGHNAGIVSEPGHPRRSYQVASRNDAQAHLDPDNWMTRAPRNEGSWWPEWSRWLIARSSGLTSPPRMGCPDTGLLPLCDAPGTYVMMR